MNTYYCNVVYYNDRSEAFYVFKHESRLVGRVRGPIMKKLIADHGFDPETDILRICHEKDLTSLN